MGMTRSDNPFGDLPEWKERQRLQEAQEQQFGAQQGGYQQPQIYGHAPAPHDNQVPFGNPASDYTDGSLQQPPGPHYYGETAASAPQLHYRVPPSSSDVGQDSYDPQQPLTVSPYEPQPQGGYSTMDPSHSPSPTTYANTRQTPAEFSSAQGDPRLDPAFGLRDAYYEDNGLYQRPGPAAPSGNMSAAAGFPGYDNAGQAGGSGGVPNYFDQAADSGGQWSDAQAGVGVTPRASLGFDDELDGDEDDYYDDDLDDDRQRYSWKMLAAIVVTGAVITGGGVVLYDSLTNGGIRKGGQAPIIRADQGPAKTAPVNAGGRQFANRDSKLLGRLDDAGNSKATRSLDAGSEGSNRVRSVPTVRIGRDGQLILPKAPEAVKAPAPAAATSEVASVSGQRIAPGINVVDTLNGGSSFGLGSLPAVQPKAEETATRSTGGTSKPALQVKPLNAKSAPKSTATSNRATAPNSGPPPVPGRSSVGSAWRMTNVTSSVRTQPDAAGIRPTIARPVQPVAQTRAKPRSASSVAARPVTPASSRKFVAVLATEPTRMKALQSFAELQQKHPNALLNRVPDVQKADLSARGLGIMYRVVVGPAGSRSSANSVCSSLKSEGYVGCWVKNN